MIKTKAKDQAKAKQSNQGSLSKVVIDTDIPSNLVFTSREVRIFDFLINV